MDKISVKAIRVNMNLTQAQMAQKLGLSLGGYQKKENGERKFSFEEIDKLSEFSGVGIQYIKVD